MLDEGYAPLPDVTVGNTLVLLYYCADWSVRHNERLLVHTRKLFMVF
jgi:hypothetical protein